LIPLAGSYAVFVVGSVLLGAGTAMVYPTLLAAIGDVAHPSWRASATGVYRLWRDLGYAVGALVSGVTADLLGARSAVCFVAVLTLASGVIVALRLRETRRPQAELGLQSGAGARQPTVPTPSTIGRL
jgi:MFS family permease